jgi:GntR family transcriptional regulator, rspAB operon transcriptional repressor
VNTELIWYTGLLSQVARFGNRIPARSDVRNALGIQKHFIHVSRGTVNGQRSAAWSHQLEDPLTTQNRTDRTRRGGLPLSEIAYEQIRTELLARGEQAFGGRLVEHQIALRLSLSRTPVRDALRRLHLAGLIEALPGGGFTARRPRPRDVSEAFELRLLLEPYAAGLAAGRPQLVLDPPAHAPAGATQACGPFHLAVSRASGNETLASSIAAVHEIAMIPMALDRGGHANGDVHADHEAIYSAIRQRDAPGAADAMARHLLRVRARFIQHIGDGFRTAPELTERRLP